MNQTESVRLTSLGLHVRHQEGRHWLLDLTHLKLFTGLSVIASLLADDILEQKDGGTTDVVIKRKLIPEITPELASLSLNSVIIYARSNVLKNFSSYKDEFHIQLRSVFGTLQRPRWGGLLFPELFEKESLRTFQEEHTLLKTEHPDRKSANPPGLLFPYHLHFEREEIDYYFLVERDVEGQFLRITIERERDSRLNLSSIPHMTISDLDRRTYIQGLTKVTDSIIHGIRRESESHYNSYVENERHQSNFFKQLQSSGLTSCNTLTIQWPVSSMSRIIVESSVEREYGGRIKDFIKKSIISLEDREVVSLLLSGALIEIHSEDQISYLDLSRKGQNLNISLEERRREFNIESYLNRMPELETLSHRLNNSFQGYRIFLIHHITSEILATIKAIENMGAANLNTLFVKYAGVVPPDYLETLHTLPEERFVFHGLRKIESHESVEGYYRLSRQYSLLYHLDDLDRLLEERKYTFFDAMRLVSGYLFFIEALLAKKEGKKLLLIEDGGYLAPELNRLCNEGITLADAMKYFGIHESTTLRMGDENHMLSFRDAHEENKSVLLSEWLNEFFPGSVEHTRNGYDRLQNVQMATGNLAFPAMSIAISNVKRGEESREVAVTILHAIESILHSHGLVLSRRKLLVLGHRGAIGMCLLHLLAPRLGVEPISGVDLVVDDSSIEYAIEESTHIRNINKTIIYDVDVIIGVVGSSILETDFLEDMVINTNKKKIFFASGSTKTMEFSHLSSWISELQKADQPVLAGQNVIVESENIRDPQTSLIQGSVVRMDFVDSGRTVELYLLGGLTPINFLYYGVPTESMDAVLTQLLQVSGGFLNNLRKNVNYPRRLLAVDHEVDTDANLRLM